MVVLILGQNGLPVDGHGLMRAPVQAGQAAAAARPDDGTRRGALDVVDGTDFGADPAGHALFRIDSRRQPIVAKAPEGAEIHDVGCQRTGDL